MLGKAWVDWKEFVLGGSRDVKDRVVKKLSKVQRCGQLSGMFILHPLSTTSSPWLLLEAILAAPSPPLMDDKWDPAIPECSLSSLQWNWCVLLFTCKWRLCSPLHPIHTRTHIAAFSIKPILRLSHSVQHWVHFIFEVLLLVCDCVLWKRNKGLPLTPSSLRCHGMMWKTWIICNFLNFITWFTSKFPLQVQIYF